MLGLLWAGGVYATGASLLHWLFPVAGALLASIPVSALTSRVSLGQRLRHAGIFMIPEETSAPPELAEVAAATTGSASYPGFVDAVVDPSVNALMCAIRRARSGQPPLMRAARLKLAARACTSGANALSPSERMTLLGDPLALSRAHEAWRQARHAVSAKVVRLPESGRPSQPGRQRHLNSGKPSLLSL